MAAPPPSRRALAVSFWLAVALSAALPFFRLGRYVLYPFAWIATWAHELGHGLTALALGGDFESLKIFTDLGGVAFTRPPANGIAPALVAAGGLLGPALVGGGVVVLGARSKTARFVLTMLALALALSTLLWIRNVEGFAGTAILAVALLALAALGAETPRLLVTQLVGIQLCLASVGSLDYMFTREFSRDGVMVPSDTELIARQWLLPYWVWGALIAAGSFLILALAFRRAWLRGRPASATGS